MYMLVFCLGGIEHRRTAFFHNSLILWTKSPYCSTNVWKIWSTEQSPFFVGHPVGTLTCWSLCGAYISVERTLPVSPLSSILPIVAPSIPHKYEWVIMLALNTLSGSVQHINKLDYHTVIVVNPNLTKLDKA